MNCIQREINIQENNKAVLIQLNTVIIFRLFRIYFSSKFFFEDRWTKLKVSHRHKYLTNYAINLDIFPVISSNILLQASK